MQKSTGAQVSNNCEVVLEESDSYTGQSSKSSISAQSENDATHPLKHKIVRDDSSVVTTTKCFPDELFDYVLAQLGFENTLYGGFFNSNISSHIGLQDCNVDYSTYSSFISSSAANHLGIDKTKCKSKQGYSVTNKEEVCNEEGVEIVAFEDKSVTSDISGECMVNFKKFKSFFTIQLESRS